MDKINLITFFIFTSLIVTAQSKTTTIKDSIKLFKTTDTSFKSFHLKKVESAYDLALNLSYLNAISNNNINDYLTLPVIEIDKKPALTDDLKKIKIEDILEYQFSSGKETQAIYGTRAQYGLLSITLTNWNNEL